MKPGITAEELGRILTWACIAMLAGLWVGSLIWP